MIRHPVWTSLAHTDYQRAIAWAGALGVELGEAVAMFAAAGIAAIEGGPPAREPEPVKTGEVPDAQT